MHMDTISQGYSYFMRFLVSTYAVTMMEPHGTVIFQVS
jgi:hypothetical protein